MCRILVRKEGRGLHLLSRKETVVTTACYSSKAAGCFKVTHAPVCNPAPLLRQEAPVNSLVSLGGLGGLVLWVVFGA